MTSRLHAAELITFLALCTALDAQSEVVEQSNYFPMGFENGIQAVVPSIDAAGVTYHPPTGTLFVVDSEINEVAAVWNRIQANVFQISPDGHTLVASYNLAALGNDEPTGITFNTADSHFYVTNDDSNRLYRYSFVGGVFAEVDLIATSRDAEGVTSDPSGHVYVLDGTSASVLEYSYNSRFKLIATYSLGGGAVPTDPEGIAYDTTRKHLFVVSGVDRAVFEHDLSGNFLASYGLETFFAAPVAVQGLAFGFDSTSGANPALYLADGGLDNGTHPNERDAAIYEARIVPSPPRGSFEFAGTDYLQVPGVSKLYPSEFSIAAWVRPSAVDDGDHIVSSFDGGGYSLGINIRGRGRAGVLSARCKVDNRDHDLEGSDSLSVGRWHHTALTFDGSTIRLYLDGEEIDSKSASGTLSRSAGDLFIAAKSKGNKPSGEHFPGGMDDVALWSTALSSTEVRWINCNLRGATLPSIGDLEAHWSFSAVNGNKTPDDTSNGHDAEIFGASHVYVAPRDPPIATFRNVVANPATYDCSTPRLGNPWTATVNHGATRHTAALLILDLQRSTAVIGNNYVLLLGAPRFMTPVFSSSFTITIPNDCRLSGNVIHSQAVHVGGAASFALTNARDLRLGY